MEMANGTAVVMILQGHRWLSTVPYPQAMARELGKRTGPATTSKLPESRLQQSLRQARKRFSRLVDGSTVQGVCQALAQSCPNSDAPSRTHSHRCLNPKVASSAGKPPSLFPGCLAPAATMEQGLSRKKSSGCWTHFYLAFPPTLDTPDRASRCDLQPTLLVL